MIGIKGTGMSSLAAAYASLGVRVSGSDVHESFYTDIILSSAGITPAEGFHPQNIPEHCDAAVYSPAFTPESNPEMRRVLEQGIPLLSYVEAADLLTSDRQLLAVAGTHGKSSSCAMIDHMLDSLQIPHISLYGTSYIGKKGSLLSGGQAPRVCCIEACEYRDHFLSYHPEIILLTSIGFDHPDHFRDIDAVIESFISFVTGAAPDAQVFYAEEDLHALSVIQQSGQLRPDIIFTSYAPQLLEHEPPSAGCYLQEGWPVISLPVPGRHMAWNLAGAASAVDALLGGLEPRIICEAAAAYPGALRRSEEIGRIDGILFIDDYGHHPDEIEKTISALRSWYEPSRVFVDFIPHTISRTRELFGGFVLALGQADRCYVHPVFATVREEASEQDCLQMSRSMTEQIANSVLIEDHESVEELAVEELQSGDLFITMGAGNNRKTGHKILSVLASEGRRS